MRADPPSTSAVAPPGGFPLSRAGGAPGEPFPSSGPGGPPGERTSPRTPREVGFTEGFVSELAGPEESDREMRSAMIIVIMAMEMVAMSIIMVVIIDPPGKGRGRRPQSKQ